MEIKTKKLSDLKPAPYNPRTISDKAMAGLRESIERFGLVEPIVVNKRTGNAVGGHQRLKVLEEQGVKKTKVVVVDLPKREEKVLNVTLNNPHVTGEFIPDLQNILEGFKVDIPDAFEALNLDELYQPGQDGSDAKLNGKGNLAERFLIPPFSVFNAREGWWQDRKKAWIALGIESELGRGDDALGFSDAGKSGYEALAKKAMGCYTGKPIKRHAKKSKGYIPGGKCYGPMDMPDGAERALTGTSIFDPVLCEIIYRWFSPPDGTVLDPFAGGSVRGIVAAKLGRKYIGVDLSANQVEANREQWETIGDALVIEPREYPGEVKVSAAMANLKFHPCDPDYIKAECHASCCQSSTAPGGTMITIHPSEEPLIEARGGIIRDGLLQSENGRCPFKTADNLCSLHLTDDKPFGCIASPFTLNKNDTLIIRNRYKSLKCYKDGKDAVPAYKAFRASLDLIFGEEEARRICAYFEAGGRDIMARISKKSYAKLVDNDQIKHGVKSITLQGGEEYKPTWHVGDGKNVGEICTDTEADLIFTCPPYVDLEVYSDDPADLSTMQYPEFIEAYRDIISKSCELLKPNRFAAIVVGEVRDKQGHYHDFIGDTVQAFRDAGLEYYNEAILVTAVGSLPIRAGKQFSISRKLGKTHQNVLVFLKGDAKKAVVDCGEVEIETGVLEEVAGDELKAD